MAIAAVAGGGFMLMRGKQDVPSESYTSLSSTEEFDTTADTNDTESFIVDFDDAMEMESAEDDVEAVESNETPEAAIEPVSTSTDEASLKDDLFDITYDEVGVSETRAPTNLMAAAEPAPAPDVDEPTITIANLQPTYEEPEISTPAETIAPAAPVITVEMAAARGNKYAQYEVAKAKLNEGDFTLAASLMKKAANQDVAVAQYRLAKMYERGQGLPRDLQTARQWTEDSQPNAGNVKAMHDLAVFYAEGEGGAQSYAAAVECSARPRNMDSSTASTISVCFTKQGLGVSPNLSEALYWFEVANRFGDAVRRQDP